MSELSNTQKWLHRTSSRVDHETLDRMADVVMDGMNAVAPGKPMIVEKITVLTKVLAMLIARYQDAGFDESAHGFTDNIGVILLEEIARFREAAARDAGTRAS